MLGEHRSKLVVATDDLNHAWWKSLLHQLNHLECCIWRVRSFGLVTILPCIVPEVDLRGLDDDTIAGAYRWRNLAGR